LTPRVLILRPQPAASATAERARALGLDPVVAPLFEVAPLPWEAPDPRRYDAILLASANAPRLAGAGLAGLLALPAYAVGEATGEAARAAGFGQVRIGPGDGAAALALAEAEGARRILHLCGRDRIDLERAGVAVDRIAVYAADAVPALPRAAADAIAKGAVALVHSPRAARRFGELVPERRAIRLALISAAAAEAAGEGWAAKGVAARPRDEALLEVARRLCQSGPPDAAGAGS